MIELLVGLTDHIQYRLEVCEADASVVVVVEIALVPVSVFIGVELRKGQARAVGCV